MKYKMLHLLQWRICDIINTLPKIAEQGFNAILISPCQEIREDGWEYWKLYQPLSYKIGNRLGSANDIQELCNKAGNYGIQIIADVLLRNVASETGDDIHKGVDPNLAKHVDVNIPQCDNWEDRHKSTMWRVGLPLVKYWEPEVQKMQINFLNELVKLGIKGFRIDMAKHIALPNEGCNYFIDVLKPFQDKGIFIYGEVLNSPQWLLDNYATFISVCTESHMYMTKIDRKVTHFESHDNYHTLKNTLYLTKEQMLYEWNKLVNCDKVHAIFFARPMEDPHHLSDVWLSDEIKRINLGGM